MDVFNGTDLVLVVETSAGVYKPIAGAEQFQITVNRTIRPVSHKHTGPAEKNEYGRYNWDVSIDGLKSYLTDTVNYDWFLTAQLAKTKVKFLTGLLDYQTAGKTPLSQSAEIPIIDAGDLAVIDDLTTEIQATDNYFTTTDVIAALTPKANYGLGVIESVEMAGADDDNPTFSVSLKGDGSFKALAVGLASGYSAEFQAVYNAWTNKPAAGVATAMNTLVESLKTAGVWAKLDAFYLWAAHSNADGEALINWINPGSHDAVIAGSVSFTAFEGLTGGGAGGDAIELNFIPSTDGVNYTLNSACFGLYIRNSLANSVDNIFGANDGSTDAMITVRYTTDNCYCKVNQATNTTFTPNSETAGMWFGNRTASNAIAIIRNKIDETDAGGTTAASGLPTVEMYALKANGLSQSGDTQQAVGLIGAGLTQSQYEDGTDAIEVYMDSNGKGVIT